MTRLTPVINRKSNASRQGVCEFTHVVGAIESNRLINCLRKIDPGKRLAGHGRLHLLHRLRSQAFLKRGGASGGQPIRMLVRLRSAIVGLRFVARQSHRPVFLAGSSSAVEVAAVRAIF